MALSNMNKDTLTRLFQMLNINENKDNNTINKIRSNYATYSKLELIAKQVNLLKIEAETIIDNHNMNLNLEAIECSFKKVPGNYYYVYEKDNKQILSMVSPDEGNLYDNFLLKVYYDYDHLFHII